MFCNFGSEPLLPFSSFSLEEAWDVLEVASALGIFIGKPSKPNFFKVLLREPPNLQEVLNVS